MGRSARRRGARGYADRRAGGARPGGREPTGRLVEGTSPGTPLERAVTTTDDAVRHARHSCAGAETESLDASSSGEGVAEAPDGSGCSPKAAVRDARPAAH